MSDRDELDELQGELRQSWIDLARELNDEVQMAIGRREEIPRELVLNLNQVQAHIDRLDKQSRSEVDPAPAAAEELPANPLGNIKLHGAG